MISPLNGAPAFACNLPLGHPVLEVPPVVVGDFGDEGGDREEHEDGRDGHDDVEVVQDALFVVRRESLFQGRPFLLRQNTLPVKFMFHDALDVRSGFLPAALASRRPTSRFVSSPPKFKKFKN